MPQPDPEPDPQPVPDPGPARRIREQGGHQAGPARGRGARSGCGEGGATVARRPRARTLERPGGAAGLAGGMAAGKPHVRAEPLRPGSVLEKYARMVSSAHYGCVL